MRHIVFSISIALGLAGSLAAGAPKPASAVLTVILDFKGPHSPVSVREMERDSGFILKSTGVNLEWRTFGQETIASYADLVVMTFKGTCEFEPAPPRYDELGPLAITRTTNGEIKPFGEVDCDRVVNTAKSAMSGIDYSQADLLIGRALGRVVAHELVHMLTRSGAHGSEGVEKPALSGKQLITGALPLSAFDIGRLRQEHIGRN